MNLKHQQGLTIVELMIAVVLGLILTTGIIQIFIGNKQTYRVTEAHARLQDNARFALEVLSTNIRSAGYSGCRAVDRINPIIIADAPIPAQMTVDTIVSGSEADSATTWSPALAVALGAVITGTDVITLQHASSCGGSLVGNIGSSNANIKIASPNSCNLAKNDVVMISDCENAHIFKISNEPNSNSGVQTIAHANDVNGANHFCKSYPTLPTAGACSFGQAKLYGYDAELFNFSSLTYFIRLGVNGDPALWVYNHSIATNADNPSELIEGIENLQIEYGADDNDDNIVDRYVDAKVINNAGDWNKVVSAQISLLAQTLDTNLTSGNQTVNYNGGAIIATDGRLRRVFTTTIGIRNRVQ